MSDPPPDPAPRAPHRPSDLDQLKDLLVGPERLEIDRLRSRLSDLARRTQDTGEILPDAIEAATSRDRKALGRALMPAVEGALRDSIQRDPSTIVGVVFPIIGPSIRRAIADALGRLVQSVNLALEYGFSWRGWTWRLEAWRTGRSFADVLIYHTLLYRVEEVFLIHRHTGLLLLHAHAPDVEHADSELVAGMLSAIQDFVRDSFRPDPGEALHQLQIGDLHLWVESGPLATLAAVVRGQAPNDLRVLLQRTLEHAHLVTGEALAGFQGDATPFEAVRPRLEDCLQTEYQRGKRPPGRAPQKRVLILAAVAIVMLAFWFSAWLRERRAWSKYVARLQAEDGLVVLRSGRDSGRFLVEGLRDPLAVNPWDLLPTQRLDPASVTQRWRFHHSLDSNLVVRRARHRLPPPDGTRYLLDGDVLVAEGQVPSSWLAEAGRLLLSVPGIESVRIAGGEVPAPAEEPQADALRAEVRKARVFFASGTQLLPGQDDTLDRVAEALRRLADLERNAGRQLTIRVVGHTDSSGPAERNPPLSHERARAVADQLIRRGVEATALEVEGRGAEAPLVLGLGDTDRKNRRVEFDVNAQPAEPATAEP